MDQDDESTSHQVCEILASFNPPQPDYAPSMESGYAETEPMVYELSREQVPAAETNSKMVDEAASAEDLEEGEIEEVLIPMDDLEALRQQVRLSLMMASPAKPDENLKNSQSSILSSSESVNRSENEGKLKTRGAQKSKRGRGGRRINSIRTQRKKDPIRTSNSQITAEDFDPALKKFDSPENFSDFSAISPDITEWRKRTIDRSVDMEIDNLQDEPVLPRSYFRNSREDIAPPDPGNLNLNFPPPSSGLDSQNPTNRPQTGSISSSVNNNNNNPISKPIGAPVNFPPAPSGNPQTNPQTFFRAPPPTTNANPTFGAPSSSFRKPVPAPYRPYSYIESDPSLIITVADSDSDSDSESESTPQTKPSISANHSPVKPVQDRKTELESKLQEIERLQKLLEKLESKPDKDQISPAPQPGINNSKSIQDPPPPVSSSGKSQGGVPSSSGNIPNRTMGNQATHESYPPSMNPPTFPNSAPPGNSNGNLSGSSGMIRSMHHSPTSVIAQARADPNSAFNQLKAVIQAQNLQSGQKPFAAPERPPDLSSQIKLQHSNPKIAPPPSQNSNLNLSQNSSSGSLPLAPHGIPPRRQAITPPPKPTQDKLLSKRDREDFGSSVPHSNMLSDVPCESPAKQFKIDTKQLQNSNSNANSNSLALLERIRQREETLQFKRLQLSSKQQQLENLADQIAGHDTKIALLSSRTQILEEKLRIMNLQLQEAHQARKDAFSDYQRAENSLTQLEKDYLAQKSFQEQERMSLCELEIEEKFQNQIPAIPVPVRLQRNSLLKSPQDSSNIPNTFGESPLQTLSGSMPMIQSQNPSPAPQNPKPTKQELKAARQANAKSKAARAIHPKKRSEAQRGGKAKNNLARSAPVIKPPQNHSTSPSQRGGGKRQPGSPHNNNNQPGSASGGSQRGGKLPNKSPLSTEGIFSPPNIGSLGSNIAIHPSILPPVAPNTPLYALTNPDSGNSSQPNQINQNAMQISPRSPIGVNRTSPPPPPVTPSPSSIQIPPRSSPQGNQIGSGSASLVPQNKSGATSQMTTIPNQPPVVFTPQGQSGNPQNLNLNSQTFHSSQIPSGNSPQIPPSGNPFQQIPGNTSQINFGGIPQNPPPVGNSLSQIPPSKDSQIQSGTSQNSPVVPALNSQSAGNIPLTSGSNQDKLAKISSNYNEENLKLREQVKQEKEQISKKIQTVQDRLQKVLSETSMKSGKTLSEPQKVTQQEKPLLVTVDRLNHFSGFLNLQANFVLPGTASQSVVNSPSSISPQSISPFQRLQKSPNSILENPPDSQNSENSDSSIRLSSIPTPGKYSSPLQIFRAYRLSPHFALTGKSRIAPEFLFSFDPKNVLCRFELHGVCNDDQCPWEHFRTSKRNTTQLVDSFVEYAKQRSSTKELSPELLKRIQVIKQQIGSAPIESLINNLVSILNQEIKDGHYLPLCPSNTQLTKRISRPVQSAVKLLGLAQKSSKNPPPINPQKANESQSQSQSQSQANVSLQSPVITPQRITQAEPMENFIHHNMIPLYDSLDDPSGNLETLPLDDANRYFGSQSVTEYEKLVKEQPQNIYYWLKYAIATLHLPNAPPSRDREVLRILARALEKNQTSTELWKIYLELFSQRGSAHDIKNLLLHVAAYLPLSYTIWHLRWTIATSIQAKLENLNLAIEQFLHHQDELPSNSISEIHLQDIASSNFTRSGGLLNFILSYSYILCSANHTEFVIQRLVNFLMNQISPNYTCTTNLEFIPFEEATKFLSEDSGKLIWKRLNFVDQVCLVIHVAHLVIFGFPVMSAHCFTRFAQSFTIRWNSAKQISANLLASKVSCVQNLFEQFLNRYQDSPPYEILPVYLNYVGLESHLGSLTTARTVCQAILRRHPNMHELWELYAQVESHNATVAQLVYRRALRRFPESYSLVFSFASFLMNTPEITPAQVICALVDCISLKQSGESTEVLNRIVSAEELASAKQRYHELLDAPANSNNVFLWLNFALLKQLSGQSPQPVFEKALLFVSNVNERKFLYTQYMLWQVGFKVGKEKLLEFVDRLFSEFGPERDGLLLGEISPEVRRHKDVHNYLLPASVDDFSFFDEIFEILLNYLPEHKADYVLNLYLKRFPRNVTLHYRCAEFYIKQNKFNSARRAFVTALKLCPNFALCWQRLVEFEISQGVDKNEIFALLLSATAYLPENETLRQKLAEFSVAS